MKLIFKMFGFLFNFISPFVIVYLQYTVLTSEGSTVKIKGIIIILFAVFSLIKFIEKKKNIAEIQDKYKISILTYTGFKRIGMSVGLYWVLNAIDSNIAELVITAQLLTLTFILGMIFNILGNLPKKR